MFGGEFHFGTRPRTGGVYPLPSQVAASDIVLSNRVQETSAALTGILPNSTIVPPAALTVAKSGSKIKVSATGSLTWTSGVNTPVITRSLNGGLPVFVWLWAQATDGERDLAAVFYDLTLPPLSAGDVVTYFWKTSAGDAAAVVAGGSVGGGPPGAALVIEEELS